MQRHEAEGTLDHAEYQAAITILNYRHVCRLDIWPDAKRRFLVDPLSVRVNPADAVILPRGQAYGVATAIGLALAALLLAAIW